ncbi:LytR/AlgR family response regulator transcription factor [Roseateles sp. BYS180W]|uniref:LytR/AlgR family response regulator transcription factor n=1 Tax=Roseateles rivi TaxID=3299028 RepID=A0ABW7FYW3_9BURK
MSTTPRALIADDEPLLRDSLVLALSHAWPELSVVAQARNGREALELFDEHQPDIVFLDVHMPGMNGMEAAKHIGKAAHLVFVTAYEQYALQAFDRGALDYLVKPLDDTRLTQTVQRLKERLALHQQARVAALGDGRSLDDALDDLARRLARRAHPEAEEPLQWLRASVGNTVKLIAVEHILYLRSDEKYTLVVSREGEALIRTPIRELVGRLDPKHFAQIHRSVVVNLNAISHVTRGANETADVHLRGRSEVLPVSRSYLHLFRQM